MRPICGASSKVTMRPICGASSKDLVWPRQRNQPPLKGTDKRSCKYTQLHIVLHWCMDAQRFSHPPSLMRLRGFDPNLFTVVSLALIVAQSKNCRNERSVHGYAARRSWPMKYVVLGNPVMETYANLGAVDSASKVYEEIPLKDVISWNTLVSGYTQNSLASEAIAAFNVLQEYKESSKPRNLSVYYSRVLHVGAL